MFSRISSDVVITSETLYRVGGTAAPLFFSSEFFWLVVWSQFGGNGVLDKRSQPWFDSSAAGCYQGSCIVLSYWLRFSHCLLVFFFFFPHLLYNDTVLFWKGSVKEDRLVLKTNSQNNWEHGDMITCLNCWLPVVNTLKIRSTFFCVVCLFTARFCGFYLPSASSHSHAACGQLCSNWGVRPTEAQRD